MKCLRHTHIEYGLLEKAKNFYEKRHFNYLEVDWIVPHDIINITSPAPEKNLTTNKGVLVASAEQSFLKIAEDRGFVFNGSRLQSITPCFRPDEDDESHSSWFMKLELFTYFGYSINADHDVLYSRNYPKEILDEMLFVTNTALKFFKKITPFAQRKNLCIAPTGRHMYDITYNGIEIGSYGIRTHKGYTWVYGTGIALPRFNYALAWERTDKLRDYSDLKD